MRAGSLDREIVIERVTTTLDDAGTPQESWATLARLRAALIDDTASESQSEQGASSTRLVTFQTRFFAGVTVADRITFEGQPLNLLQVKEIGRRRGLELKAERVGP